MLQVTLVPFYYRFDSNPPALSVGVRACARRLDRLVVRGRCGRLAIPLTRVWSYFYVEAKDVMYLNVGQGSRTWAACPLYVVVIAKLRKLNRGRTYVEPALVPLPTPSTHVPGPSRSVSDAEGVNAPNVAEDTENDGDTSQAVRTEGERHSMLYTSSEESTVEPGETSESEYFPMPKKRRTVFARLKLIWATLVFFSAKLHNWLLLLNR